MGFSWANGPEGGTPVSAAGLNSLLQKADLDEQTAAVLGNPTSETTLALDARINPLTTGRVQGTSGRAYRVVAGVLRNSGSGWAFLDDSGHRPTNITSVSANSTGITINYGFTGTRVAALLVTPDETFAQQGITAGASVGLSSSTIRLGRPGPQTIGDYVQYNGSAWSSLNGVFTGLTFTSGTLALTHTSIAGTAGSATGRAGATAAYDALLASVGPTLTQVEWFNASRTKVTTADANMRAYVTRTGTPTVEAIDPTTISAPTANLWVLGLIEVAP